MGTKCNTVDWISLSINNIMTAGNNGNVQFWLKIAL